MTIDLIKDQSIISRFPDGQQNVTLENLSGLPKDTEIKIKSRLNNWRDLELIVAARQCLKRAEYNNVVLFTPYILGARSDRKFSQYGNNYLKDVLAPIINSQSFTKVICADPHSYVLEATIDNLVSMNLQSFYNWCNLHLNAKDSIYVSPDAGAEKRVLNAVKYMASSDIITCLKERDKDGKITKTIVPSFLSHANAVKDIIIIDDICDGGQTFIEIAKELKKETLMSIHLIVTHGIFSKGFGELAQHFDSIYCTNSYSDINMEQVAFESKGKLTLKQYNIYG